MKIVSKFRDYYDSLAYVTHDPSLVFVRKPEVLHTFSDFIGPNSSPSSYRTWDCTSGKYSVSMHRYYIGFCGVIYPVLKIVKKDRYNLYAESDIVQHAYTTDDTLKIIDAGNARIPLLRLSFSILDIKDFFDKKHFNKSFNNYFLNKRVASFIIEPDAIKSYPILKQFDFGRIFDPYSAIQKIEMFLTNDLAPQDVQKAWPISDKLKAESHGFDKHSFRKDKSN